MTMSENIETPEVSSPPVKRKPGRPPRADRTFDDTKTHLIQCGLVHLTEYGYFSSGLEAILKEAKIPKGSFYYYFKNKEDFCHAVLAAYGNYFSKKLKKHLEDDKQPPLERIHSFVRDAQKGMAKFEFKRGCLVGNLMQESPLLAESFTDHLQEILAQWQCQIAECLSLAKSQNLLHSEFDSMHQAGLFWSGWEGAVMRAKLFRSAQPLEDFWQYYKANLLHK